MQFGLSFCGTYIPSSSLDIDIAEFLSKYVSLSHHNNFPSSYDYYIIDHLSELLEFALLDLENEYGKKSFVFLSSDAYFTQSNNFFKQFLSFINSSNILSKNCPTPILINRVACIFSNILKNSSRIEQGAANLIIDLIPYIECFSVFDMIQNIFQNNKYSGLRSSLKMLKFKDVIKNELLDENISSEKLSNLLQIIKLSLENSTFADEFRTEEFVEILNNFLNSSDTLVLNSLWQAICSLCSKEFVTTMQFFIHNALELLAQPFSELHMYHSYAMDLLCKVILYKSDFFEPASYKHICEIVVKLSLMFNNSINLISSIFRLINAMLHTTEGKAFALNNLFPLIITESTSPIRTAFAAHSLNFLSDITQKYEKDKIISAYLTNSPHYSKLRNNFLNKYTIGIREPYGGKMSRSLMKKSQEIKSSTNNMCAE